MGIEIKLDTNALSSLIDSDPEFRTKIQQSVLTNIANRYLKVANDDINKAIESAAVLAKKEVAKEFGSYTSGYPSSFQLHTGVSDNIKLKVKEAIEKETTSMIATMIDNAVTERLVGIKAKIEAKVAVAMIKLTDQAISTAVSEHLKTKLVDAVNSQVQNTLSQIKF